MKVIVISLESASYRRRRMERILSELNIDFEFFNAFVGANVTKEFLIQSGLSINLNLTSSELGCLLSHIYVWRKFVESDFEETLILEDDVHFADSFKLFIQKIELPSGLGIFKLETMLSHIKVSKLSLLNINGINIHRSFSPHAGAAGYVLNKQTAEHLLSQLYKIRNTVDIELFDPFAQKITTVPVYQCIPALIIQDFVLPIYKQDTNLSSQIGRDRVIFTQPKQVSLYVKILTMLKERARPFYLWFYNMISLFHGKISLLVKFDNDL